MQDMRKSHRRKILNLSLLNDESGIALIYVTIVLPVIIGFALLSVDVGRFLTLNSAPAHGIDALALAGRPNVSTAIDPAFATTETGGGPGTLGSS